MIENKIIFQTLQPIDDGVVTFERNQCKITSVGSVGNQNLTITNVYFVERLNFNLLSVNKFYDNGYHVKFDSIFVI
jgi:hypothetical protein